MRTGRPEQASTRHGKATAINVEGSTVAGAGVPRQAFWRSGVNHPTEKACRLKGKLNLIASKDDAGSIIAAKTGRPSPSRGVQVMVYMYAAPEDMGQYLGVSFDGKILYTDHQMNILTRTMDEIFTTTRRSRC